MDIIIINQEKFWIKDKSVLVSQIANVIAEKDIVNEGVYFGSEKELLITVVLKLEKESVSIKYLVTLFKNINEFDDENNEDYTYSCNIARITSISELKNISEFSFICFLVNLLDTLRSNPFSVTAYDYQKLNFKVIFNIYAKLNNDIRYCIKISDCEIDESELLIYKNFIPYSTKNRRYVLKLLPLNHMDLYKNRKKTNGLLEVLKNDVLFEGTLDECKSIFYDVDKRELLFKKHIYEEYIKTNNNLNFERDYFEAMTDGQLGDFDDFNGNLDDIDLWSRG